MIIASPSRGRDDVPMLRPLLCFSLLLGFARPSFASTHDAVILAVQPINAKIRAGRASVAKRVRVKVTNGNLKGGAEHDIRLTADAGDCPAGVIVGAPDFDRRVPGDQDVTTLRAGKSGTAMLTLEIASADFVSFNRRAPERCTLQLSVESEAPGNVDPTPDNNAAFAELNVYDFNDPEQASVHEAVVESFRASHPGKIEIRAGRAEQTKFVKPVVVNADVGENPGDTLTLVADDGDCPPGTVGLVDFDRRTAGEQNSVVVRGGRKARGKLAITVRAEDFYSPSFRSQGRCVALLTVAGPGGDGEASNDTTRMVINVFDRNDL